MRVVIDTNVVVSAFLSNTGAPAQLLAHLEREAFVLLVSEPILHEYEQALNYPKVRTRHRMSRAEIAETITDLCAVALLVDPAADFPDGLRIVAADPDDDKFFECAAAGNATHIVSGDAKVQAVRDWRGIRVVSPAHFLELLQQDHD